MKREIFISLNHRDAPLADAMVELFEAVFGSDLNINYSTKAGAIGTGENWYEWIVNNVVHCDIALILITPNSVQAPWLMWESGAVYGAALAANIEHPNDVVKNKVWPIIIGLKDDEIPAPIRDATIQRRRGDREEDLVVIVNDLYSRYQQDWSSSILEGIRRQESATTRFLSKLRHLQLNTPNVVNDTVLQEWRNRIRKMQAENRSSEVNQLERWMEITFGYDVDGNPEPVDFEIHTLLGDIYLGNKDFPAAAKQFELARRLSSRDIFILRQLGRLYLETDKLDEVEQLVTRIEELDASAFVESIECAALKGKYLLVQNKFELAAQCYVDALNNNTNSYYLSNLAAEAHLKIVGSEEGAKKYFKQTISIINNISDNNIWTAASKMNAYTALGDRDSALREADNIVSLSPNKGELNSIIGGLKRICEGISDDSHFDLISKKLL